MSASLQEGISVLKEVIDTPTASYFSSCVHCGLCAEACLFYTETGDPRFTPIYKLEPLRRVYQQEYTLIGRLSQMLGLSKPVTDEELEEWKPLVYDSCTLCGRCSLVCPVGNDLVYMVRRLREGMAISGHAPDGLVSASKRAIETGSPMGVRLPALKAQMGHVHKETGIEIPLDVAGAEYMVLMSSMEIINFPEYLGAVAKIMKQAGKSWTLCSEAFEATNSGVQMGVSDIARTLVQRIVDGAKKLKVKTVISPECGHAYTALRWEGPNLIGHPYTFNVLHILEVLDCFHSQGLLKTSGYDNTLLTFHDPCQLVRRGGVLEEPRKLLNLVAKNYVETSDPGKMNWCCGGGGGVSAIEETQELRFTAFKVKKSQLEEAGAMTLVTACANCRIVLEEGLEHYKMDIPVVGLTEMIANHLTEGA